MGSISTKLIILPPPHAPLLSRTARHHPVPCMDSTTVPFYWPNPPLSIEAASSAQLAMLSGQGSHCPLFFGAHKEGGRGREGGKQTSPALWPELCPGKMLGWEKAELGQTQHSSSCHRQHHCSLSLSQLGQNWTKVGIAIS